MCEVLGFASSDFSKVVAAIDTNKPPSKKPMMPNKSGLFFIALLYLDNILPTASASSSAFLSLLLGACPGARQFRA